MDLRQLDIHLQNNEVEFLPHTIHKITKWISDLNVRAKTIKFLEVNLFDLGLSNGFLDTIPKT